MSVKWKVLNNNKEVTWCILSPSFTSNWNFSYIMLNPDSMYENIWTIIILVLLILLWYKIWWPEKWVWFAWQGFGSRGWGCRDGFCEWMPEASSMSDRANASQLQDGALAKAKLISNEYSLCDMQPFFPFLDTLSQSLFCPLQSLVNDLSLFPPQPISLLYLYIFSLLFSWEGGVIEWLGGHLAFSQGQPTTKI